MAKTEAVKAGLAQGGTQAAGGLLGGIAQGLMLEDQPQERNTAGLPAGNPSPVHATQGSANLFGGRAQLGPDRQSMALEMLRAGGYK